MAGDEEEKTYVALLGVLRVRGRAIVIFCGRLQKCLIWVKCEILEMGMDF